MSIKNRAPLGSFLFGQAKLGLAKEKNCAIFSMRKAQIHANALMRIIHMI